MIVETHSVVGGVRRRRGGRERPLPSPVQRSEESAKAAIYFYLRVCSHLRPLTGEESKWFSDHFRRPLDHTSLKRIKKPSQTSFIPVNWETLVTSLMRNGVSGINQNHDA